jgi:hypothetical protein
MEFDKELLSQIEILQGLAKKQKRIIKLCLELIGEFSHLIGPNVMDSFEDALGKMEIENVINTARQSNSKERV